MSKSNTKQSVKGKPSLPPLAERIKRIAKGKGQDITVCEEGDGTIRVRSSSGISISVKPKKGKGN